MCYRRRRYFPDYPTANCKTDVNRIMLINVDYLTAISKY